MRALFIGIASIALIGCAHQPAKTAAPNASQKVVRVDGPVKTAGRLPQRPPKLKPSQSRDDEITEVPIVGPGPDDRAGAAIPSLDARPNVDGSYCRKFPTLCGLEDSSKPPRQSPAGTGGEDEATPVPGTEPGSAAKALSKKIKGVVPVYFQTNRVVKDGEEPLLKQVTYERSPAPTFGVVEVSIPIAHKLGKIELPQTNFLGFVEAEDTGKHFTVLRASKLTREQFVAGMANDKKSLMLFVHGYNVSFSNAAFTSAQIAFDVNYEGRVVMFSWPSKAGLLDYDYDRESAVISSDALFDLLKTIKNETDITRIVVIAHSLGSEVVIGALHQASLTATKLGITELIFAASDVSRDMYLQRAEQIKASAEKVTLYASSSDRALLASLKKAQSGTRMGYVLKEGPTLVPGVETIDVTAVGADMFALNHSTYAKSRAVLDDIGRLLLKSDHPPHERTTTLERRPDKKNIKYWLYVPDG